MATASVQLHQDGQNLGDRVVIQSEGVGSELQLVTSDGGLVGVIAASSHADVEAVLASGLEVELKVDGETLLFTAQDAGNMDVATDAATT